MMIVLLFKRKWSCPQPSQAEPFQLLIVFLFYDCYCSIIKEVVVPSTKSSRTLPLCWLFFYCSIVLLLRKWSCPQPSQAEPLPIVDCFLFIVSVLLLRKWSCPQPSQAEPLPIVDCFVFLFWWSFYYLKGSGRALNQVKPNPSNCWLFFYCYCSVIKEVVVPSTKSSRTTSNCWLFFYFDDRSII
jgi:hypothetical protein